MKNFLKVCIPLLFLLLTSCDDGDDGEIQITVNAVDVNLTIFDNVMVGDIVGRVVASTNKGVTLYSIVSQSPEGAFNIDAANGELIVANAGLFEAISNPLLNLDVEATNGNVSAVSKVTINLLPAVVDNDGDGVLSDTDDDDTDPCIPSQTIGYDGFDSGNPIWLSADCDSDGASNELEITNATDPYDEASGGVCTSTVDTAIWEGKLQIEDNNFTFNEIRTYPTRDGNLVTVGCGTLIIVDPFDFGPCETGDFERLILKLTPNGTDMKQGIVELSEFVVCSGSESPDFSFDITNGLYDEENGEISFDYSINVPNFSILGRWSAVPIVD